MIYLCHNTFPQFGDEKAIVGFARLLLFLKIMYFHSNSFCLRSTCRGVGNEKGAGTAALDYQ